MDYTTDANFCAVIPILLAEEGGYVDDPNDPGGATNFGISQRSYPALDIQSITQAQASQIYFTDYWVKGNCNTIPYPLCAYHFDACVNQGITEATKILQHTVGVPQDGVAGPQTMSCVAALNRSNYYLYLVNRFAAYRGLAEYPLYGVGWVNRMFHLAGSV